MATPEQYISNSTRPISMKQAEILNVIARGNPDGSYVDRHQLRDRLSYNPHVQSVHFSLRYMVAQKRVEVAGKELRTHEKFTGSFQTRIYRITELGRLFISASEL